MSKRDYYLKNKEKILKARAEYRERNKEKIKEEKKQSYLKNKEKILKARAEYVDKNREKISAANKKRWAENPEQHQSKEYYKNYREKNREKIRVSMKKYNALAKIKYQNDPAYREKHLKRKSKYRQDNPEKANQFRKNANKVIKKKYYTDSYYRLTITLRNRLRHAMKAQNTKKHSRAEELAGCSIGYLKKHFAKLFQSGMSWDNQGKWHIDHIIPVAKFDLRDPEQQKICFHYTNLQPLWAIDNLKKGAK